MGIGPQELILILFAALLLFGPDKIPELSRALGKAMGEFKKAQFEAEHNLQAFGSQHEEEKDLKIRKMAMELGINTENKNIDELLNEIQEKITKPKIETNLILNK